ncbi:hypothetical protein C2845_PM12G10430 [Panicum miliaceum]|uniref:Uncharacterized protein n=1 Tax=Panicum miliaceum TaxID=4540 RepID=A0A3L6QGA6_PANMI|nr:hypothetical protein C2845_PM12G10430 [Panicum miliaceum]
MDGNGDEGIEKSKEDLLAAAPVVDCATSAEDETTATAAAARHVTTAISTASGNEIMAIDYEANTITGVNLRSAVAALNIIGIQDVTVASSGTQSRKRKAPLSPPITFSGLDQTQSGKRKAPLLPPVTVSDLDHQSIVIPERHALQIWSDLAAANLLALHALKKGNPQSAVEAKAKEILFRQEELISELKTLFLSYMHQDVPLGSPLAFMKIKTIQNLSDDLLPLLKNLPNVSQLLLDQDEKVSKLRRCFMVAAAERLPPTAPADVMSPSTNSSERSLGAALGPFLTGFISRRGWDSVFVMLALCAFVAALLLSSHVKIEIPQIIEKWRNRSTNMRNGNEEILRSFGRGDGGYGRFDSNRQESSKRSATEREEGDLRQKLMKDQGERRAPDKIPKTTGEEGGPATTTVEGQNEENDTQGSEMDIASKNFVSSQKSAEEGEIEMTQINSEFTMDMDYDNMEVEDDMPEEELVDYEDENLINEKAEMDRLDKIFEEKAEGLSGRLNINIDGIERALNNKSIDQSRHSQSTTMCRHAYQFECICYELDLLNKSIINEDKTGGV